MSGDTLTIVLFLIGTAVSLAVAAMSVAGWRHPLLIRGLFIVAAILAATALAWPFLGPQWSVLRILISKIATSPVAWFAVVLFGLATSLLRPPRPESNRIKRVEGQSAPRRNEEQISANALYVGGVQANIASLTTDFFVELTVKSFNGTGAVIAITGLEGSVKISSSPAKAGSTTEIGKLPAPRIKEEVFSVKSIQSAAEFYVALEQRIPRSVAERMAQVIDSGDVIQLGMNDLNIFVSPLNNPDKKIRLPLWNGISVRKFPDFISSGRIIEGSVRMKL
ncbi:MAG: hypothetical protein ACREDL_16675 [Bradyrhizobium sp.]